MLNSLLICGFVWGYFPRWVDTGGSQCTGVAGKSSLIEQQHIRKAGGCSRGLKALCGINCRLAGQAARHITKIVFAEISYILTRRHFEEDLCTNTRR
jgi:hypothetical protein